MVNHKDGNRSNNHISNLEWCDGSHNQKHSWKNSINRSSNISKKLKVVFIEDNSEILFDSIAKASLF